jgi:hypothetical protein
MKPSTLKEHLQIVHTQNAIETEALFKNQASIYLKQEALSNHGFTAQKKPAFEASPKKITA